MCGFSQMLAGATVKLRFNWAEFPRLFIHKLALDTDYWLKTHLWLSTVVPAVAFLRVLGFRDTDSASFITLQEALPGASRLLLHTAPPPPHNVLTRTIIISSQMAVRVTGSGKMSRLGSMAYLFGPSYQNNFTYWLPKNTFLLLVSTHLQIDSICDKFAVHHVFFPLVACLQRDIFISDNFVSKTSWFQRSHSGLPIVPLLLSDYILSYYIHFITCTFPDS